MHALGRNACQLACLARRSLFAASSNAQAWSAHSGMSSLQGASQPGSAGLSASATATSGTTVPTYPAPDASRMGTADLCDVHYPDPVDKTVQPKVQIMQAGLFRDFGGSKRFSGQVTTVKCYENNPLVRKALEESGRGRVLVVDGGGSMRCALLGDMLADMGAKNGWSGIIVHGCIRDSEDIGRMPLGVKALATHPLKSAKRDPGLRDVPVTIGDVTVRPGDWVYADMDGVLVSPEKLSL